MASQTRDEMRDKDDWRRDAEERLRSSVELQGTAIDRVWGQLNALEEALRKR
jgi:hypothetical protein